jgi:hypothetical protein
MTDDARPDDVEVRLPPPPAEPERPITSFDQEASGSNLPAVRSSGELFHASEVIRGFPQLPEPAARVDAYNFAMVRLYETRIHELQFDLASEREAHQETKGELAEERDRRTVAREDCATLRAEASAATRASSYHHILNATGGLLLFVGGLTATVHLGLAVLIGAIGSATLAAPMIGRRLGSP